ncbi:TPA: hypothetical protein ENS27_02985 [bacterium]|nr:hypothetical protein [bacterium]
MKKSQPCPACRSISEIENAKIDGTIAIVYLVNCPRCGKYQIDYVARDYLNVDLDTTKTAVLSHAIRVLHKKIEIPFLDQITVARLLQGPLPKPNEQMMNFVLWLGDKTGALGVNIQVDLSVVQSEIGAVNIDGVRSIIAHLVAKHLIEEHGIAGTLETASLRIFMLTLQGWDYYDKLKQVSDTSNTGKLLKFLIESPTSPYGDPDLIKKSFSWDDEQFRAVFAPLKKMGFIDAQYADNEPFDIWVTTQGHNAVADGIQPESSTAQNNNTYNQFGNNVSIQASGNNQNVIVGNNSSITNGLTGSDIAQLFDDVFRRIDQQNISKTDKQEIRETVELIQVEVSKGEEANEKTLTAFFRSLQRMAPDILDVTLAAATNPMLAASVIAKKVVEKIKADAK